MADYEQKPGTMSMFKVTPDKKKSENSPDFQGSGVLKPEDIEAIMANGGKVRISAWTKLPKGGGTPYISGFIEAQKERENTPAPPQATDDFMMTPAIKQATEAVEDAQVVESSDDLPF